jgi:hypothetical protein
MCIYTYAIHTPIHCKQCGHIEDASFSSPVVFESDTEVDFGPQAIHRTEPDGEVKYIVTDIKCEACDQLTGNFHIMVMYHECTNTFADTQRAEDSA